jgi:hypothetical protein
MRSVWQKFVSKHNLGWPYLDKEIQSAIKSTNIRVQNLIRNDKLIGFLWKITDENK